MKKLIACFIYAAFSAPTAFAAGDAAISRAIPGANSNATDTTAVAARTAVARTASSADVEKSAPAPRTVSRSVAVTNNSTVTSSRDGATVSRSGDASRAVQNSTTARSNLDAAVHTVGRNARVTAASVNSNPSVRRAGVTLRPSTAEVGGRATIGNSDVQTGSNLGTQQRSVTARAASVVNRESIAEAKERLEQTAELNKSCQEQYNECMDQFCAVIDANQKRCSCSANLSRYTKVESAVKDANNQLNEVAQRIRYVGLSADEIRAIMTATEAEEALSGKTDTTETRSMLDNIEKLIKDPISSTSYTTDTFGGLELDLDFSSDSGDMFSLDFLNTNSNSFSNLRGTELYNAAKKRCNTIINQCKEVGATAQQITGNYDLAIDKDCIAYEQGLTKMNETLVSNVRSANRMLQKARLAVLQNKNQYDIKGCVAALESCMTDDMVCGSDYTKCLDPTKIYIDENGEVVLGQNITNIKAFMSAYNNANIDMEFLSNASTVTLDTATCSGNLANNGSCTVRYLLQKIGTGAKVTDGGLCRAVLDKCQNYTYDSSGNYKKYNDVVVNYIQRAMVNIKSAQEKIISDYASSCMTDIASCYNQQVSQVNSWSSSASINSIYNVMRGACRNVALTCAYAVFQDAKSGDTYLCPKEATGVDTCLTNISEMFYQSLLCPDNSVYDSGNTAGAISANGCETQGDNKCYINARCYCKAGYQIWGSSCLVSCGPNANRNTYGTCTCKEGYTMKNNSCVKNSEGTGSDESDS